jgi:para-aminobenzoate synthetase/4-amino-4-deoxychorismate lyase
VREHDVDAAIQLEPRRWLLLKEPCRIVIAETPDAVRSAITTVERLTREQGLHAAGFLSYEAGAAFGLTVHPTAGGIPLAWFALFEPAHVREAKQFDATGNYRLGALAASVDRETFGRRFADIKERLGAGDTYQVNYTFRLEADFAGDARQLFADLVRAQQGAHAAFLSFGCHSICSASPELFFERIPDEDQPALARLTVRPMKGTVRRGLTLAQDADRQEELRSSPKQRAENVMIVDMMRNDVGRIAEVGSVQVAELFSVERYPNVWQMTSTVVARTRAPLVDIFAALHPSASVTGAPKAATMKIIAQLEGEPRGVYTGAIGWLGPDGRARFNVAIRTAVVDRQRGRVSFGVGSGIVWDSDAGEEYRECLTKGGILGRAPEPFELLETMRRDADGGFYLLDRHLRRLEGSASYFGFPFDRRHAERVLFQHMTDVDGIWRVRLLLSAEGVVRVERAPHVPSTGVARVALARTAIDAWDPFVHHKTTNRAVYDRARQPGFDDTVLWNERGEVTEATLANVVVDIDGAYITPPIASGLLAGTLRAELIERRELEERIVTVDDLRHADRIWLINSVQGRRPAILAA